MQKYKFLREKITAFPMFFVFHVSYTLKLKYKATKKETNNQIIFISN